MNNFHQKSIQSDDHEPAKAGSKETYSSILQGMTAKPSSDMNQLKVAQNNNNTNDGSNLGNSDNRNSGNNGRVCCRCGSKDHLRDTCPQKEDTPPWRHEILKQGEPD